MFMFYFGDVIVVGWFLFKIKVIDYIVIYWIVIIGFFRWMGIMKMFIIFFEEFFGIVVKFYVVDNLMNFYMMCKYVVVFKVVEFMKYFIMGVVRFGVTFFVVM